MQLINKCRCIKYGAGMTSMKIFIYPLMLIIAVETEMGK
jgi:hypothetical protein